MINLGLTVTFATLKYPLTQFPLPEEGGGRGKGKRQQYLPPISQKHRQRKQNSMETWLFTHR